MLLVARSSSYTVHNLPSSCTKKCCRTRSSSSGRRIWARTYRARGVRDEDVHGPWSPVTQFEIEAPPWEPLMILLFLPMLLLL
jgi:hypothetical protein